MALERTTLHSKPAIERRPAPPARMERKVAATAPSPARALQQRLGNQGIQDLLARRPSAVPSTTGTAAAKSATAAERPSPQRPGTAVTPEKHTALPTTLNGTAPVSKAPPQGPSSVPGGAPPAGKPAAGPAIEGPGKAAAAPGGAKVPAGGPGGKEGGAEARAPEARTAIAPVVTAVHHRAAGARKHAAPRSPLPRHRPRR